MSHARLDQLQSALVDELIHKEGIRSRAVEAAFRSVPRHLFLPDVPPEEVYSDQAIVTKTDDENIAISSSSQPVLMAAMLESLDLRPGDRVLEIGAGTGYNAALLAHVVGRDGLVVSVDIDADLVESARRHLHTAGYDHVEVLLADGGDGAPLFAPFDAILVTVGVWDIPPAWLAQLKPGRRLIAPIWFYGSQLAITFQKDEEHLVGLESIPCGFVRMQGAFAGPETVLTLDEKGLLQITLDTTANVDPHRVRHFLQSRYTLRATGIKVDARQIAYGLYFWLGIHTQGFVHIHAFDELAKHGSIPRLFGNQDRYLASAGLMAPDGLALLMRASVVGDEEVTARPFQLWIAQYGDRTVADRLLAAVAAWNAASRPHMDEFSVTAYPMAAPQPAAPAGVVSKRWMRYHFTRR